MEDKQQKWKRTGKVIQEVSENGKGVVTLEEERSGKKVRLVATGYKSVVK